MNKIAIPQGLMDNIDITVERLLSRKFTDDPLFPGQLSKIASVVGSAYKRHGLMVTRLDHDKYAPVEPPYALALSD